MQSPFSGIISMHTIFVTSFHSSNVMSIHFSLSISALTLSIMDFTTLGQIVTCMMQLTIVCLPTIESSTGERYEMHVETKQWNINYKLA